MAQAGRGFGVYWGAAELDGGRFGGASEGTKAGAGRDPRAPRTHGPGPQSFVNPKLAHFSIIKIFLREFRMDIKFARRNETLKGNHVCGKEL